MFNYSLCLWWQYCLQVIFSLEKKKFRLVVDGIRAQDGQLTTAELNSMQQFVSPVHLGTAPESLHKELKVKWNEIKWSTHWPIHTHVQFSFFVLLSWRLFQDKVYPGVSAILKWMEHQCQIQPPTTARAPALRDRHKEGFISQGMEHMSLSVSTPVCKRFLKKHCSSQ